MKLIKALVVMLVAVGMILPAVAVAEDRLSLSGEMRVRGWYDKGDWDDADFKESKTYADQRLRIAGKLSVAEGVSITFRTDITEQEWGAGSGDFGQNARSGSNQQWDRAHIDLTKGDWSFRVGQQFFGTGTVWAFDSQDPGVTVTYNGSVPVKAFFVLDNQNSDSDPDYGNIGNVDSDALEYGVQVSPKGDNWKASAFVVGQSKKLDSGEEVYLIGANGSTSVGPVNLTGEVDFFTGDYTSEIDAMGTQVFLDASMAATDAITIGGQFYYAAGDDEDKQYTILGNGFNGWDPIFDVGTSLSNEQMDLGDSMVCDAQSSVVGASLCGTVFDFSGGNAGVVGGRLYASMKAGPGTFGASAAYLTTEEDDNVDMDGMFYAAGYVYPLMENTSLQFQLQYTDVDVDSILDINNTDTDWNDFQAGTGLFVKF
jgi:hypothetical protein